MGLRSLNRQKAVMMEHDAMKVKYCSKKCLALDMEGQVLYDSIYKRDLE